MPQGLIVKALSGYYYVLDDDASAFVVRCRARGVFKKKGLVPLVGDRVVYSLTENDEGTVEELLPRTSELVRPPIANVDLAMLVFSIDEPAMNLQLLDKFLVHTENAGLETVICFSKHDLASEDKGAISEAMIRQLVEQYALIGYEVMITSARKEEGIARILKYMEGRIAVFAGQSGVGKSSLLNAMMPHLNLETNRISAKLGRGKHTTRHVELIPLPDGGFVADTPGFSQLDFQPFEPEDLAYGFREFRALMPECKFRGCLHRQEPGCRVIEARNAGEITSSRYEHYLLFLEEIMQRKRRY